jgi:uncharacterized protein YbjT (DUF2867 family)
MIVVTGATGNVGRPLVRLLADAGEQVTAVSRRRPAEAELPEGVTHRQADLADPESLRPALDGASALLLMVGGYGEGLNPQHILEVAGAGGVRRVVLLSSLGTRTRPAFTTYDPLRGFEDAVQNSGLDWTILQPGALATLTLWWAETIRRERMAAAPFADVGVPFIDPADVAEVAAVTLREDGHTGRVYELTGPALVTSWQRAAAVGEALGTPVRFVEQTREEARALMLRFMPEPAVDETLAIFGKPLPDEQRVSPDVEQVLGRPPRTFAEWAARNAVAFK